MAVDGYFLMQIGFTGKRQSFQLYPPGVRTPNAKLAAVFPANTANTGQSPQILVMSSWGNALSSLYSACATNENLKNVRLDFWSTNSVTESGITEFGITEFGITEFGITEFSFTLHLPDAQISNKQSDPNFVNANGGNDWKTFGFHFKSLRTSGLLPAHLRPLLNFRH